MPERINPALDRDPRDLPAWINVLVTDDMPIRWATEPGRPHPGDELTGRLVIGDEEQLTIDLCGTAATKLLAVLVAAHHGTELVPALDAVRPIGEGPGHTGDGERTANPG